jgi:hypothetical protein
VHRNLAVLRTVYSTETGGFREYKNQPDFARGSARNIISVMVNSRTAFATTWLGTAALLFAAGSADYGGSRLETAVEVLTLASALGTVAMTFFAFRSFWRASSADSGLVIFGLVCSPFVVGGLLALNGTQPNLHFTSMGGLLFYGLVAEGTAVTLLVSRAFGR